MSVVDVLKLVGLDRGQGHVQLTLQPHQESDLVPKEVTAARRRRRAEGVSGLDKAAFGVNNLLILAISPVKSENHCNLDIFLSKVQLKEICLRFCGDLKVYNEITGIQTCTSTFPCPGLSAVPIGNSRNSCICSVTNSSDKLIFVKIRAKDGQFFSKNTVIRRAVFQQKYRLHPKL